MPPLPLKLSTLNPYPRQLSRALKLTLFPLDVTTPHTLQRSHVSAKLDPLIQEGSPLAEWTSAFVHKTLDKMESLTRKQADIGLELHDPLTIWWVIFTCQDLPSQIFRMAFLLFKHDITE